VPELVESDDTQELYVFYNSYYEHVKDNSRKRS